MPQTTRAIPSLQPADEASPAQIGRAPVALYLISKLGLIASFLFLARSIRGGILSAGLLAAWACHPKPLPVGGLSLFMPMMTHAEIALILGLVGLEMRLRGHRWVFWAHLGAASFVHSLIAIHLALIVVPCLPLLEPWSPRRELKGAVLFGALSLVYLRFLAPPHLSPAEAVIFLGAKGEMQHVSPWQQSTLGWGLVLATLALAAGRSIRVLWFQSPSSSGATLGSRGTRPMPLSFADSSRERLPPSARVCCLSAPRHG